MTAKQHNIQIFGLKRCQDTRKAERYFKERAIPYHYVDLAVRGLSKGELEKVSQAVGLENLIDKDRERICQAQPEIYSARRGRGAAGLPAAAENPAGEERAKGHGRLLP